MVVVLRGSTTVQQAPAPGGWAGERNRAHISVASTVEDSASRGSVNPLPCNKSVSEGVQSGARRSVSEYCDRDFGHSFVVNNITYSSTIFLLFQVGGVVAVTFMTSARARERKETYKFHP